MKFVLFSREDSLLFHHLVKDISKFLYSDWFEDEPFESDLAIVGYDMIVGISAYYNSNRIRIDFPQLLHGILAPEPAWDS